MLPPVDPHVLEQNPRFNALYTDLTTTRLNPDGTTINYKDEAHHAEIKNQLYEYREKLARIGIVREALLSLVSKSSELPDELQEVIVLLVSESEHEIRVQAEDLLRDDKQYFMDNIDIITPALTTHLTTLIPPIAALLSPEDPSIETLTTLPPPSHHPIPAPSSLPPSLSLAHPAATLHSALARLACSLVPHLERAVHGPPARRARARAEHLAAVARALELKARIAETGGGAGRGDAEVEAALRAYERHLVGVETAWRGRVEEARRRVEGYEVGKGMREVAGRYAAVVREVEEVRREVEELERRLGK